MVNSFWAAAADGDGEAACALLTERGQRLVRVLAEGRPQNDVQLAADCPTGVAGYSERLPGLEDRFDLPSENEYVADDVHINQRADEAWVQCRLRGAILVRRARDAWRVDLPACTD